jgi:hypothetical protein
MILPDFNLPTRSYKCWEYFGMDRLENCLDKKHFKSYPHQVQYNYNSRGFRDHEWPTESTELQNAIWCIGDSFTVGLGSPVGHTWPNILQQKTGEKIINVSMDGASNKWIARKAIDLLTTLAPKTLIIHWSYIHRREIDYNTALEQRWRSYYSASRDSHWPVDVKLEDFSKLPLTIQFELQYVHRWNWQVPDDNRVTQLISLSTTEDIDLTIECINAVNSYSKNCKVIHSFIPEFINNSDYISFCDKLPMDFDLITLEKLDLARDGHHYDIITSEYLVKQLLHRLGN